VLDQPRDMAPDAAMVVAVEVLPRDDVGDPVEGLVVEQQRAEQRLLRLDRVRWNLQRNELCVGGFRARDGLNDRHYFFDLPARIIETRRSFRVDRSKRGGVQRNSAASLIEK